MSEKKKKKKAVVGVAARYSRLVLYLHVGEQLVRNNVKPQPLEMQRDLLRHFTEPEAPCKQKKLEEDAASAHCHVTKWQQGCRRPWGGLLHDAANYGFCALAFYKREARGRVTACGRQTPLLFVANYRNADFKH